MTSYSFYSEELQLADDNPHNLTPESQPFFEANIHIYDNDVCYGSGAVCSAIAVANSVLTFTKADLVHLFFKNRTAGNNGKIVVVATVPLPEVLNKLRL